MGHIKSVFSSDPNKEVRKERVQVATDIAMDTANRKRNRTLSERDHEDLRQSELLEAELDSIRGEASSKDTRRYADDDAYGTKTNQQVEIQGEKARQDLQMEKLSAMQNMAAAVEDRENAAKTQKAELDHKLAEERAERVDKVESEKRESFRDLSPEQILAIQAGELAGKGQDVGVIASAISGTDAEREKAAIQAKLHKEMLEVVKESGAKTTQAYKDAAVQARSMGEQSLDTVAKIAGAQSKPPKKPAPAEKFKQTVKLSECMNPDCDAKVGITDSKFCGECGWSQSD